MPTFYFDVRGDGGFIHDEDGLEVPDLATAEREAAETAATIARDRFGRGEAEIVIDIRDERGARVATVAASVSIIRARPRGERARRMH